jgi:hypothetical protein
MNLICFVGVIVLQVKTCAVKWVANGTSLLATNELRFWLPAGLSGGPLKSAVRLKAVSVSRTITSCVASA